MYSGLVNCTAVMENLLFAVKVFECFVISTEYVAHMILRHAMRGLCPASMAANCTDFYLRCMDTLG